MCTARQRGKLQAGGGAVAMRSSTSGTAPLARLFSAASVAAVASKGKHPAAGAGGPETVPVRQP